MGDPEPGLVFSCDRQGASGETETPTPVTKPLTYSLDLLQVMLW